MLAEELNTNAETIYRILREGLWKGRFERGLPHTDSGMSRSDGKSHQVQTSSTSVNTFAVLFTKVKTALKERGFRMLKTLKQK
jgi:hypothetical protein